MFSHLLTGEGYLRIWFGLFIIAGLAAGVWSGFFQARKIQPKGFKWITFRNEAMFSVCNLIAAGLVLGPATQWLTRHGVISLINEPAPWWRIAIEYAAYFLLFDTWFYWLHRWMHKEPVYTWVHKIHHRSTSPNMLTTFSVNPLESFINGGFVPLFVSLFTVHGTTMALIAPTNVLMGLYLHSGYEFLPRWWNKQWATKWFITTTFHDQHHKYFNYNFGGYTTIWDRLCGTVRKKYDTDFEERGARRKQAQVPNATVPTT
jgi:sterol desaturase/sphingolipid hydroxylase (fatty acid hydroxylase superfamily)